MRNPVEMCGKVVSEDQEEEDEEVLRRQDSCTLNRCVSSRKME